MDYMFTCPLCSKDCGTSMCCPDCIPLLNNNQYDKLMRSWHEFVVMRDGQVCVYCGLNPYNDQGAGWKSGELCGNHIEPKRVAPRRIFDVTNGESCCKLCNGKYSSVPHSQMKKAKDPKNPAPKKVTKTYCKEKGCMLMPLSKPYRDGYCVKHQ